MRGKNRRVAWNIDVEFFSAAVTVAAKGGRPRLNLVSFNILECRLALNHNARLYFESKNMFAASATRNRLARSSK